MYGEPTLTVTQPFFALGCPRSPGSPQWPLVHHLPLPPPLWTGKIPGDWLVFQLRCGQFGRAGSEPHYLGKAGNSLWACPGSQWRACGSVGQLRSGPEWHEGDAPRSSLAHGTQSKQTCLHQNDEALLVLEGGACRWTWEVDPSKHITWKHIRSVITSLHWFTMKSGRPIWGLSSHFRSTFVKRLNSAFLLITSIGHVIWLVTIASRRLVGMLFLWMKMASRGPKTVRNWCPFLFNFFCHAFAAQQ